MNKKEWIIISLIKSQRNKSIDIIIHWSYRDTLSKNDNSIIIMFQAHLIYFQASKRA